MTMGIMSVTDYPILIQSGDSDKFLVLDETGNLYLQTRTEILGHINLNTENILSDDKNKIPTSYAVTTALNAQIEQYLSQNTNTSPSSKLFADIIASLLTINAEMLKDISEIKDILLGDIIKDPGIL
jgi:hypothetical protein